MGIIHFTVITLSTQPLSPFYLHHNTLLCCSAEQINERVLKKKVSPSWYEILNTIIARVSVEIRRSF